MSDLRFLAGESCDFGVVRVLRAAGFDVLAVSEILVQEQAEKLSGGFIVVQPGRVRISRKSGQA